MSAPRMAAADTPGSKMRTFHRSMYGDRFERIARATWREAALAAKNRGETVAVKKNQAAQEQARHLPHQFNWHFHAELPVLQGRSSSPAVNQCKRGPRSLSARQEHNRGLRQHETAKFHSPAPAIVAVRDYAQRHRRSCHLPSNHSASVAALYLLTPRPSAKSVQVPPIFCPVARRQEIPAADEARGALLCRSRGKLLAPLCAAAGNHPATVLGRHACAKSVATLAHKLARLIGAFHEINPDFFEKDDGL